MSEHSIRRGDWVVCKYEADDPAAHVGFVRRAAKDGSWADVKWHSGTQEWSKRMRGEHLVIKHTIPVTLGGQKFAVTDCTRKWEMEAKP